MTQGSFFPLAAGQCYDSEAHELENGVFLGHMASLKLRGPHVFQQVSTIHLWLQHSNEQRMRNPSVACKTMAGFWQEDACPWDSSCMLSAPLLQGKTVFDFWKLSLKVGPWTASFDIKKGDKDAP